MSCLHEHFLDRAKVVLLLPDICQSEYWWIRSGASLCDGSCFTAPDRWKTRLGLRAGRLKEGKTRTHKAPSLLGCRCGDVDAFKGSFVRISCQYRNCPCTGRGPTCGCAHRPQDVRVGLQLSPAAASKSVVGASSPEFAGPSRLPTSWFSRPPKSPPS